MKQRTLGTLAAILSLSAVFLIAGRFSQTRAQEVGPGGVPGPTASSGGAVSSVFGRTGAVAAANGDYTAAQVTNAANLTAANIFTQSQTIQGPDASLIVNDTSLANDYVSISDHQGFLVLSHQVNGALCVFYTFQTCGDAYTIGWASGSYLYNGSDTAFSRVSPGVIAAGNGAAKDTSGWIQESAIGNGAASNTDLRGHVTLTSGSGTYTFTKTYAVAPTCVATDTTTVAAVKVSATTTTLTLTGTGTDTLTYICAD